MIVKIIRIVLFLWMMLIPVQQVFSQHISSNNYTGNWETPTSWNPVWTVPVTSLSGYDITINGYITVNSSLSFSGSTHKLTINDTLVVIGNLSFSNNYNLIIKDNGILLVRGDLYIDNETDITTNGYLIVTGNIIKIGSHHHGSFISNDNPVKVFIGGTNNVGSSESNYPVLNCPAILTAPYSSSYCSYGNMTDILTYSIYTFLQSTYIKVTADASPEILCAGGDVHLNAIVTGGSGSYTYMWTSVPAGFISDAADPVANPAVNTIYKVKVSDGSVTVNSEVSVVVYSMPTTPVITTSGSTVFCEGGNVTLTSSQGTGYLWSTGAVTPVINVSTTGTLTVIVTNSNGCQSAASIPAIVTVNTLPAAPVITAGGSTTFCNGGNVTLSSSTGTGYLWSTGATTPTINITSSGSYTVRVTNSNGCQSAASLPVVVTVNSLPAAPVISAGGNTTFCTGGNVTLFSSNSTSYLWSNGTTTPNINVASSGNFTVRVTNSNGCQSAASVPAIVTVNSLPAAPVITASGNTTFCAGGNVTLSSSIGTGYLWSTGATTQNINITSSGSYTVRVTNSNGCQSAASIPSIITVNPLPAAPVISAGGNKTFCAGGNVTLSSSTGTGYLWSTGATTQNISVTSSGSYTVRVTNSNGCQSAASLPVVVTVNSLPAAPVITASGNTTFCAGGNVTLTSGTGTSYSWSNGALTPGIKVTTSGSYSVRVTNSNGCLSAASAPVIVTVNALPVAPVITASGPLSFCTGGNVTLTSGSGTGYLWSGGETTSSLNITSSGSYTVRIIDSNGCLSLASVPVEVIVTEMPVSIAGSDQELNYLFETQMEADLSSPGKGEWSVISGKGHFADMHSPTTMVNELSLGKNVFLWKVNNGTCEALDEIKITVIDLFIPSVITPDGDGKNDFFKVSNPNLRLELVVFNRWGNEEYSNNNYLNDWEGRNNRGSELPNDTYFYVLRLGNGEIKKGSVLIKR